MNGKITAEILISVQASADKVWDALTNPEKIKLYFFGTNAVSDWKVGSPLLFKGVWEGKEYVDKGIILKSDPPNLFQFNYFSSFSGLEDSPDNYAVITYQLIEKNGTTELSVFQDGIDTEERKKHSEENWKSVMNGLKKLVEEK